MISRKAWTASYWGGGQSADVQCRVNYMVQDCATALRAANGGAADVVSVWGEVQAVGYKRVERWAECAEPGEDVICQRDESFFAPEAGADRKYSTSVTQQKPGPLDLEKLKKNLKDLLGNGDTDCAKWIKGLMDKAAELYPDNPSEFSNPLDRFNEFKFTIGQTNLGGTVSGSLREGNATVHLNDLWNLPDWQGQPTGAIEDALALIALHEMIHLSGVKHVGRGDYELARAADQLPGSDPMPPWNNLVKNMQGYESEYWDDEMKKHCNFKKK